MMGVVGIRRPSRYVLIHIAKEPDTRCFGSHASYRLGERLHTRSVFMTPSQPPWRLLPISGEGGISSSSSSPRNVRSRCCPPVQQGRRVCIKYHSRKYDSSVTTRLVKQSLALWCEILHGALPLRISAQFSMLFLTTKDSSRAARRFLRCRDSTRAKMSSSSSITTRPPASQMPFPLRAGRGCRLASTPVPGSMPARTPYTGASWAISESVFPSSLKHWPRLAAGTYCTVAAACNLLTPCRVKL
jgi:hypothetical protein